MADKTEKHTGLPSFDPSFDPWWPTPELRRLRLILQISVVCFLVADCILAAFLGYLVLTW